MDGIGLMLMQMLQNMGLNPDELIQTVNEFKTVAIELNATQKRIEEKLDLIIKHNNLMPEINTPLIETASQCNANTTDS